LNVVIKLILTFAAFCLDSVVIANDIPFSVRGFAKVNRTDSRFIAPCTVM
jgi:hypothetical protein